jgi:4,5-epoxidase
MDVLVVGAGPTGLALACGLRQAGVDALVVDAAAGPATTSRALGLQPRGAEVLDRLGALADLPVRGLPVRQVVVTVDGRPLARLRVGQTTRLVTRPGLMMSQAEIEAALRDRLAALGGRVAWGREVTGLTPDADGVTVAFADGPGERAGWVTGCDGAHSRVRKLAGIGFPGVPIVERFLLADVRAAWPLPRDSVATWLRGDRMLAAFPLPGGLWRLLAPQPAELPGDLPARQRLSALLGLAAAEAGLDPAAVTEAPWTSAFRIHRRLADTYRAGRLLLAGDAAHVHSPMGGQGMNTGLGDAENLAWKLALVVHGRAGAGLLDTYQAERRPVAAEVLASTSSLTQVMLGGGRVARWVRDRLVVPLMDAAWVQRRVWESASQLKVSYRRGPLGRGYPLGRAPRPGDRVADLACRRPGGAVTRLHAELRGRFAVVGPDGPALRAAAAAAAARLGPDGVVTLVADGPVLLVRPDAHLAAAGPAGAVGDWLAAAGVGPAPVTSGAA